MVDFALHKKSLRCRVNPVFSKLWLEVSDICNSRCSTCYAWKKTETENKIDLKQVLKNPLFRNVDYIINSGSGEPSLVDLRRVLLTEHLLLPKAVLQVSTNAILADKVYTAVVAALNAGAKIEVGISIDGIGEVHDKIRGIKGNFQRVNKLLTMLTELKNRNLQVTLGSTLTADTVTYGLDMASYAAGFNVPFMWHWPNRSCFYGSALPKKTNYKETVEALNLLPDSLYKKMWIKSLQGEYPNFNCWALRSFAALKCNGELVPCLTKWSKSIGNITTQDPTIIWKSKKATEVRNEVAVCNGCLNSWAVAWSLQSQYFPVLKYALTRRIGVFN